MLQQLRWEQEFTTLEQLGAKAGISGEAVRRIECGELLPKHTTLCSLAKALGADPYRLAKTCGFDAAYLAKIDRHLLTNARPEGSYPLSLEQEASERIDFAGRLLRWKGDIPSAREEAKRVITIIQAIREKEELNPSLLVTLFSAYDLLVNADTRACDTDLRETYQTCRIMQELAEEEIIPRGGNTEFLAMAYYRLADVYLLHKEYKKSLDVVNMLLSLAKPQSRARGEALRIRLEAIRLLGDIEKLSGAIKDAQEEIQGMKDFTHVTGCILQELGLSIATLNQKAALEEIEKTDRWYQDARRKGFADALLEVLIYTRWAQITVRAGPEYNLRIAREAALHGSQLAGDRYHRIKQECQSVLLSCKENKPVRDYPG